MTNILAFDTATNACSVALQVGDLLLEDHRLIPRQHSQQLLPMIDALLNKDQFELSELSAIACGIGPGSFMGVRLAVSVAQGLAYAHQLPIVAASSLQILAQTAYQQLGYQQVIAAWDARMDEIYWGAYHLVDDVMQPVEHDQLVKPNQWSFSQSGEWFCVGNAWQVYAGLFDLPGACHAEQAGLELYPNALSLLPIAQLALEQGNTISALALQPNYIRNKVTY